MSVQLIPDATEEQRIMADSAVRAMEASYPLASVREFAERAEPGAEKLWRVLGGLVASGMVRAVQDADECGWILVSAREGTLVRHFLVDRNAAGLSLERTAGLDLTRRHGEHRAGVRQRQRGGAHAQLLPGLRRHRLHLGAPPAPVHAAAGQRGVPVRRASLAPAAHLGDRHQGDRHQGDRSGETGAGETGTREAANG